MNVSIVDYGSGNLFSVARAIERAGGVPILASTPECITRAERLILPGVGAFAQGMLGLSERGLIEPIQQYAKSGNPLLGICLGMQMLASYGEEFGWCLGLNIIPGSIVPIPTKDVNGQALKIPYIGWAELLPTYSGAWQNYTLSHILSKNSVYFVHSYQMLPTAPEHRLACYDYGGNQITAIVKSGNVIGCQFHPEKSGEIGIKIMGNFLGMG